MKTETAEPTKTAVELAMEKVQHTDLSVGPLPAADALPFPHALRRTRVTNEDALEITREIFEPLTNRLQEGTTLFAWGDRLLVRRIPEAELSKYGRIFIRETDRDQPNAGVVLNCGPGRITEDGKLIRVGVPEGSVVLFGKYAGTDVPLGAITDDPQLMLHEEEVLGILATKEQAAIIEANAKPPVTAAQVG
jgi:co-chaperonin GroES (HSP10)